MKKPDTDRKRSHIAYTRLLVLLVCIALIVPILFTLVRMGVFSADPVVEIQPTAADPDAPVLRIATDYDFCPNSYYNQSGVLSGLYIEIMTEAANRLGMRPVFETGEWLQCRAMLENGEADVLLGLEIFSNMQGTLRTIPICSDDLRVYGRETIDSAAALAGKRVALMARSVIAATYDLQCEYVEYNTNTEILQAVENGEANFGICHEAVASKLIDRDNMHLQPSLSIAKSYPALAVDDAQPQLRDQLNDTLQAMSRDGTIGRLQKKWITNFTRNRSLTYVLQNDRMFYITFFFAILVVMYVCTVFQVADKQQSEYIQSLLEYQRQLKLSNEEAIRANQSKSTFLSHMSHDIRTPMNGIMGMVERIRANKDDPQIVDECLDKISVASGHLLSLLNDVLDMSELEYGHMRREVCPFDLLAELKSIEDMEAGQAAERGIRFAVHTDEVRHTRLQGSPLYLRRILLNLTSNALKYNRPNGSVDVFVQELPGTPEKTVYRFLVKDTGIGMSREFLQRSLYKPFTQENDNVRTVYQGTGLGMSIVEGLVRTLNGTIQVESEQNVGTTFTLELPFALDTAAPQQPDADAPADISGMRVLVAEDNELNREIACYMLLDAGAQVLTAENGREAVELFAASEPGSIDAVLIDIMMPVMDGMQAAQAIRALARPDAAAVPIIAMTANAFEEDRKKALEGGMDAYLTKPIDLPRLSRLLARFRAGR